MTDSGDQPDAPDDASAGAGGDATDEAGGDAASDASDPGADADSVPVSEVEHVAELARVAVDDEEAAVFAEQFTDILGYFETLDEVPAVASEPELTNVMRADEVREGLDREAALENAPETEAGYFKGPRVS